MAQRLPAAVNIDLPNTCVGVPTFWILAKKKKKTTSMLRLEERRRSKENRDAVLNFYLVTPLFFKMPFAEHLNFRVPLQYIIYL